MKTVQKYYMEWGSMAVIAGAVYTCRSIHVAAENENKMATRTDGPIAS